MYHQPQSCGAWGLSSGLHACEEGTLPIGQPASSYGMKTWAGRWLSAKLCVMQA